MSMDTSQLAFPKGRPSVLVKADKKAAATTTERAVRKAVRRRDGIGCRVCVKASCHNHHLVHRSQGGKWRTDNIIRLCQRCHNSAHGAILYLTGNPDGALYWEWLNAPLPGLPKPWGFSRPIADPRGPGERFKGRIR